MVSLGHQVFDHSLVLRSLQLNIIDVVLRRGVPQTLLICAKFLCVLKQLVSADWFLYLKDRFLGRVDNVDAPAFRVVKVNLIWIFNTLAGLLLGRYRAVF